MQVQYLKRKAKNSLAYVYTPGREERSPLVVFLGGYRSDMTGTKATFLEAQCTGRGWGFLRMDYSGHGQSEGAFEDGTIGAWKDDALCVIDHVAGGVPFVLVGSSMGGWMSLLVAKARRRQVKRIVGIAAAPDFSEDIYAALTPAQKAELQATGRTAVPNDYSDEPYHVTKEFYMEAKGHLVLTTSDRFDFPIRLIQGKQDADVPWQTAVRIQRHFADSDVQIIYVDDGDHRLSRPQDLALIDATLQSIL